MHACTHIWISRHDTAVTNGDFLDYKRIQTTNGGDVSAYLNFNLQSFCDVDLENYPNDVHHCCFHLQPKLYSDLTNFLVHSGVPIKVDSQYYRKTGFSIDKTELSTDYNDEGTATLRLCMKLSRSSTTLRVELAIPMAICGILVLIAPLFGALSAQLHVKLFGLLLQYLCLQYLANKTSQIGMGHSTPKICKSSPFSSRFA